MHVVFVCSVRQDFLLSRARFRILHNSNRVVGGVGCREVAACKCRTCEWVRCHRGERETCLAWLYLSWSATSDMLFGSSILSLLQVNLSLGYCVCISSVCGTLVIPFHTKVRRM